MYDERKSKAVTLYLSRGVRPVPTRNEAALLDYFGPNDGPEMLEYVGAVLREASAYGWKGDDFTSGTDSYKSEVRRAHPELNEEATATLVAAYSYSWRYG